MELLLGHLVGDYLLQNKWMAMNKSASHLKCAVHCFFYTCAVCLICRVNSWFWPIIVFASHYFIDRYALADKWLDAISGRSLRDYMDHGTEGIPWTPKEHQNKFWNYHVLRGGFTSLVYCAADNTMHLLIMWYGMKLLT
jgi:hypothetical protein